MLWENIKTLLAKAKSSGMIAALRAEFEAEGARSSEVAALARLAASSGFHLDVKIGGAEAVRDLQEVFELGATRIIAPMIESPYALQKFVYAAKRVYQDHLSSVKLLINIETITGCQNFAAMLKTPEIQHIFGVVIGRVDLAGSMGLGREAINDASLRRMALQVAEQAKANQLKVVVGGSITIDALPFLQDFPADYLDTRKMTLHYPLTEAQFSQAISIATEFELAWLTNKREYYRQISMEDEMRIQFLTRRLGAHVL